MLKTCNVLHFAVISRTVLLPVVYCRQA